MSQRGCLDNDPSLPTRLVFGGDKRKTYDCNAVVPPISTSKIYHSGDQKAYLYGRLNNPTRENLEDALASLEKAKYAVTFASGLAATSAIFQLLKPGSHVIAMDSAYTGTDIFLRHVMEQWNFEVSFVDAALISNIEQAIKENTKMIWLESPANPSMDVVDMAEVAKLAKARSIIFTVDNTYMTPFFQRPLELGVDLVLHSVSKYISGHSDVILGAAVTNNDELHNKLRFNQRYCGAIPSPIDCYLALRGMKTLHLRMPVHMQSALKVAGYLASHPQVELVLHPGLADHPQHELMKKQSYGYCGMLSFIPRGGEARANLLLTKLKLFAVTASLGGYESLAIRVKSIIHTGQGAERTSSRRTDIIRLSIGLENVADIIEDLAQALANSADYQ